MIKKAIGCLTLLSFLTFSTLLLGISYFIPESINFTVGQTQEISFNIPLKASLTNQDIIKVSSQNETPLTDNIKINLAETTELITMEEGNTTATVSAFGIPLKEVSVNVNATKKLIPCGTVIGVVMKTDGVLVLGTGYVKDKNGTSLQPAEGIIKTGDIILYCNDESVNNKEELIKAIAQTTDDKIKFIIKRNDKEMEVEIIPVSSATGDLKTGIWIRDSTQGLGTMTFIDENTMQYGALGHGVYDVDTKQIIPISSGNLILSEITGIKKGTNGTPGEISGKLNKNSIIGTIEKNTEQGLFGTINEEGLNKFDGQAMEIGFMSEIKEGSAYILSDVFGNGVEKFEINIESVNRFSSNDKGMIIKVTDQKLLNTTGGIIQGMSGSPIIQNNKIIGAVTHVFVNNSDQGYGIFIENMISSSSQQ